MGAGGARGAPRPATRHEGARARTPVGARCAFKTLGCPPRPALARRDSVSSEAWRSSQKGILQAVELLPGLETGWAARAGERWDDGDDLSTLEPCAACNRSRSHATRQLTLKGRPVEERWRDPLVCLRLSQNFLAASPTFQRRYARQQRQQRAGGREEEEEEGEEGEEEGGSEGGPGEGDESDASKDHRGLIAKYSESNPVRCLIPHPCCVPVKPVQASARAPGPASAPTRAGPTSGASSRWGRTAPRAWPSTTASSTGAAASWPA